MEKKKTSFGKRLPKKFMAHHTLNLSNNFGATATVWVSDEPNSRYKPMVCLSLKHGLGKINLVFETEEELVDSINGLAIFTETVKESLGKALRESLDDWHDYKQYMRDRKEQRKGLKLLKTGNAEP